MKRKLRFRFRYFVAAAVLAVLTFPVWGNGFLLGDLPMPRVFLLEAMGCHKGGDAFASWDHESAGATYHCLDSAGALHELKADESLRKQIAAELSARGFTVSRNDRGTSFHAPSSGWLFPVHSGVLIFEDGTVYTAAGRSLWRPFW